MINAHILTIGTEITSGEVVNTNAAWLAEQLESSGVRVHSHLTVRDQRDEMLAALRWADGGSAEGGTLIFVTGGLGPTSDDMTRALVAEHLGAKLEFDDSVWTSLNELYKKRGLPIREAHKHQCWFPAGSERMANPTGTALGFYSPGKSGTHYFVLPGPPRELEGMFNQEVVPRLKKIVPAPDLLWHRWNIFAVPESEVAELVEPIIAGSGLEVGYRAQVPYVRLKLYANTEKHKEILSKITQTLSASLVGEGAYVGTAGVDLAEMLLRLWPDSNLKVLDDVSDGMLAQRLFAARRRILEASGGGHTSGSVPEIQIHAGGLSLTRAGDEIKVSIENSILTTSETRALPFKMPLDSERGRRSAAEWTLWLAVSALRSRSV